MPPIERTISVIGCDSHRHVGERNAVAVRHSAVQRRIAFRIENPRTGRPAIGPILRLGLSFLPDLSVEHVVGHLQLEPIPNARRPVERITRSPGHGIVQEPDGRLVFGEDQVVAFSVIGIGEEAHARPLTGAAGPRIHFHERRNRVIWSEIDARIAEDRLFQFLGSVRLSALRRDR